MGEKLEEKYQLIDKRVMEIVKEKNWWPCSKGCDECCHQLARLPQMTSAEWELLKQEIDLLDSIKRQQIIARLKTAIKEEKNQTKHITCPMLDVAKGACMVYKGRPAACRMFGFYVSRIGNRWCSSLQKLDDKNQLEGIIFGNHDSMEQDFRAMFGEVKSLAVWLG